MLSKRKATENEVELPAKFSRIEEVLLRGNNSLMQLNEIGIKGLKWTIEQITNMFPQKFRATCIFLEPFAGSYEVIPSGTVFYCEGLSKSACKHDIANQIMDRLSGKAGDVPDGRRYAPVSGSNVTQIVNKPAPPTVISEVAKPKTNGDVLTMDSAVRILNEKMRDIIYNFVLHEDGYCCYVSFRGFVIKGLGANKKIAKRAVAVKILQKYYKMVLCDEIRLPDGQGGTNNFSNAGGNSFGPDMNKTPKNRQKCFSNLMQSMVKNGFEKLVSTLDVQYSKRKVLSGLVISRKLKVVYPEYYRSHDDSNIPLMIDPLSFYAQTGWNINPDDCGEILKLVTISSGTKCLSGSEISEIGSVINDCHAEVISKRAFQYFLYQSISRLQKKEQTGPYDHLYGCDILEEVVDNNQTVYRMKSDVKIHLYISSAPCGDSRIFLPQSLNVSTAEELMDEGDGPGSLVGDDTNEDNHPNRRNRGLLRTKIECGEGTIPIKTKHIQTWDGIIGGERLLTMSCSDKVCCWNVLGIQGALLSNVLSHPVYLDSLTVGSLFHQEHLERALYGRAEGVTKDLEWLNGSVNISNDEFEQGELRIDAENVSLFTVRAPLILTVSDQDERCPGKASNFSVNWVLGEDSFEIISTSKGLKIDNVPSRLCKRNLFKSFLSIFNWLPYLNNVDGFYQYNDMKSLSCFPDHAIGSLNYQKKKISLYKYFDKQNYGLWIGKPMEQDWFAMKANE